MSKARNIAVTFECFIKKGKKYLMLHRAKNKKIMPGVWMAPGGKREFNEGLLECVRREIKEETGLSIKNLQVKVIGNAYLKDLDVEVFFHLLRADYRSGTLKPEKGVGELVWLTPKEILKLDNLLSELRPVLRYIVTSGNKIVSYKAAYSRGNNITLFELERS